jgi:hypothetical protein
MASAGGASISKSLLTMVLRRIKQILVRLMPGGEQLIHVAEGEKDVFIPVLTLYAELREEYRATGLAELQINQRVGYLPSLPASSNGRY